SNAPIATIAGKPVYDDELVPLIQIQLQQLRNQEYQIKSRALETLVDQKVLAAAATEKGLSVDQLMKQEVEATVQETNDAEIERYYETQKERLKRPLDEVKPQLQQTLRAAKVQQRSEERRVGKGRRCRRGA